MQDIDVHSEVKNCVVTLLVISKFLDLLGASRACVDFRDPTTFPRIISPWSIQAGRYCENP